SALLASRLVACPSASTTAPSSRPSLPWPRYSKTCLRLRQSHKPLTLASEIIPAGDHYDSSFVKERELSSGEFRNCRRSYVARLLCDDNPPHSIFRGINRELRKVFHKFSLSSRRQYRLKCLCLFEARSRIG